MDKNQKLKKTHKKNVTVIRTKPRKIVKNKKMNKNLNSKKKINRTNKVGKKIKKFDKIENWKMIKIGNIQQKNQNIKSWKS